MFTMRLAVCVRSMNKPAMGAPRKLGTGCKFRSFTTSTYKLHFLEVPSGIKVRGWACVHALPVQSLSR